MTATATLLTQRYDSPTARLDITGRALALSQWSDRPVVQVHRFHLWLHPGDGDGGEPEAGVEIQGDRAQFLKLQAAVQAYVADTLRTFPPGFNHPATATETAPDLPTFTPQGLTGHQVQLGSLRTQTGASTVTLGAVQLADLAQVFAQLDQQVRLLPVALMANSTRTVGWQRWSSVAAGFVAAVGLAALWPYLNPGSPPTSRDQAVEHESVDPADAFESAAEPEPEAAAAPETDTRAESELAPAPDAEIPPPGTDAQPPTPAAPKATTAPPNPRDLPPASSPPEPTPPEEAAGEAPERDGMIAADSAADVAPEASAATGLSAPAPLSQRSGAPASAEGLSPFDVLAAELADQWQPPDDLPSTLRYRLSLNADGTVAEVVAMDGATEDTPIPAVVPAVGQRVLPPGVASALRLTLYPDGSVTVVPLAEDERGTR